MLLRLRSLAGLIASTAGIALIAFVIAALPAAAAKGDIWTQPAGTPEETGGHSQEVHLPCGSVDIWADQLDSQSGTWILYHLPPPSPTQTYVSQGTYSYTGEGSEVIATIPASDFAKSNGPHFKIEVDNDNQKSKTFWVDCKVSIATTPNPTTAAVGDTLKDGATLDNGFSPTGTVTFKLFNPSGALAHTEVVDVNGDGVYSTPTGHVADSPGTWHWQAVYSGDGGNDGVTSNLVDEPVVVSKVLPRISTEPSPSSTTVGGTLKDAATLAGGFNPTGSITFTLYDPANTAAGTETVAVAGNGTYTTPNGFVANTPGTWHWKAEYSGDSNNSGTVSDPADEPVTVSEIERAQPTLTTTPGPSAATVGDTLKDNATLSGGDDPSGTITFVLLDPSNVVAHTETVEVDGNATYSTPAGHVAGTAGTWHWEASYSGDAANRPAASEAGSEPVAISPGEHQRVQPSIATTPNPTNTTVGARLKDTATLSDGDDPSGSIVFTLYNPSGVAVHTEEVTVAGNGVYSTPTGHIAAIQGTWHWQAVYSGDGNNLPVSSNAADEPVVVGPTGGVLAQTGFTSTEQAISAGLMVFGLLTMLGALAWRRRAV